MIRLGTASLIAAAVLGLAPAPADSHPVSGPFNPAAQVDFLQIDDRTSGDPVLGPLLLGPTR